MEILCEAEQLFSSCETLLKKLSDGRKLAAREDKSLRKLLDKYHEIECLNEGKYCLPIRCSFAKPIDWIEFHGYTSMADLLCYFEYEEVSPLVLKDKKSIDSLDAHWGRRGGHYNP